MEMVDTPGKASETDALLTLELRIARRADELARAEGERRASQLECWLMAEAEVWRGVPDAWCQSAGAPLRPA